MLKRLSYVVALILMVMPVCTMADTKGSPLKKVEILIQNNLKEVVLYMAHEGGYEVTYFGDAVAAYTNISTPDYNMIFDFPSQKSQDENLKHALEYSQQKGNPFMLVADYKQDSSSIEELIEKFHYKQVAVATRMLISNDLVNAASIDRTSVKLVSDAQMLDEYCSISDEVYNRPAGSTKLYFAPMKNLLTPDFQVKLYLAYYTVGGTSKPVGTAMLYLPQDKKILAGHYGWAVKNDYRQYGIMTNLVKNMIIVAKEQGYPSSVAQCYDASVRLAQRIGFESYRGLEIYLWNPTTNRL